MRISLTGRVAALWLLTACDTSAPVSESPPEGPVVPPATTGIEFRIATTGQDLDLDGYQITLGGNRVIPVPSRGIITTTTVAPGTYSIQLGGVGSHCLPEATNPTEVEVRTGSIVTLDFAVSCGRAERIAFTNWEVELPTIWAIYGDGTSPVRLVEGYSPAWSPDGSKLVFVRDPNYCESGCGIGVYVLDLYNESVSRLTTQPDDTPTWSPNGERIAFVRRGTLYTMNAEGSELAPISTGQLTAYSPAWSPDGSRLAFACGNGSSFDICTIRPDGLGFTRLTSGTSRRMSPAWSPDGSRIAFTSATPAGTSEIMVMSSDGSNLRNLGPGAQPSWSPDGSRLAIGVSGRLVLMNEDGSGRQQLTSMFGADPAWRH